MEKAACIDRRPPFVWLQWYFLHSCFPVGLSGQVSIYLIWPPVEPGEGKLSAGTIPAIPERCCTATDPRWGSSPISPNKAWLGSSRAYSLPLSRLWEKTFLVNLTSLKRRQIPVFLAARDLSNVWLGRLESVDASVPLVESSTTSKHLQKSNMTNFAAPPLTVQSLCVKVYHYKSWQMKQEKRQ